MSQPNASATVRRDLYQHVTTRILEDLERGVRPWLKPWSAFNSGEPRETGDLQATSDAFELLRQILMRLRYFAVFEPLKPRGDGLADHPSLLRAADRASTICASRERASR
jgi:hypothetical protein